MKYLKPRSIGEAVDLLASSQGMVLAGGTDACVYMAEGICSPEALIDIGDLDALKGIETVVVEAGEETVRIGACTTLAEIAASELLPNCLRQGAHAVGSPQIRNLGTIGGNVCNASPCGDTLAPLLTLDARLVLRSTDGTRIVASSDFFTGPKQTVMESHEILEAIEFPAAFRGKASAFRMIGNRKGQAISQVNAAVCVTVDSGTIADVRVAVGSVAPIPLRLAKLEEFLPGRAIADVDPNEIREPVIEGIRPIDDVRSTATYRQEVTVSLVFDALRACAVQVAGEGAGP